MKDWLISRLEEIRNVAKEKNIDNVTLSTNWVLEKIKKPTEYFTPVDPKRILAGKFYVIFYNLKSSNSKLEKYSISLVIDERKYKTKRVILGMNIHFLPLKARILFFNAIFNSTHKIFETNKDAKSSLKEQPIPGVDYKTINKILEKIGFEYSIRLYEEALIDKCYSVSLLDSDKLILFNSRVMTGVDENTIANIWKSKQKDNTDRSKKLQEQLQKDWDSFEKGIEEQMGKTIQKMEKAKKSLDEIDKFTKK